MKYGARIDLLALASLHAVAVTFGLAYDKILHQQPTDRKMNRNQLLDRYGNSIITTYQKLFVISSLSNSDLLFLAETTYSTSSRPLKATKDTAKYISSADRPKGEFNYLHNKPGLQNAVIMPLLICFIINV